MSNVIDCINTLQSYLGASVARGFAVVVWVIGSRLVKTLIDYDI